MIPMGFILYSSYFPHRHRLLLVRFSQLSILPNTFHYSAIGKGSGALSIPLIIPILTYVFCSTGKGSGALSIPLPTPIFTYVFFSIGKGVGALSIIFPIPPLTYVLGSIGIGIGALSIIFPTPILTYVLGSLRRSPFTYTIIPSSWRNGLRTRSLS